MEFSSPSNILCVKPIQIFKECPKTVVVAENLFHNSSEKKQTSRQDDRKFEPAHSVVAFYQSDYGYCIL